MDKDLELLIITTRSMRKYQKRWYQFKNGKDLVKAKSLEMQVDDILKRIELQPELSYTQKGLFTDDITDF